MSFFRWLFKRRPSCFTYVVARNDSEAVHSTWYHGGNATLSGALLELTVKNDGKKAGGPWKIYYIRILVEREVDMDTIEYEPQELEGTEDT